MCVSAPKAPAVQQIPMRAMAMLPDNGDPAVRAGIKNRRNLTTSASIFANKAGVLGAPMTSAASAA